MFKRILGAVLVVLILGIGIYGVTLIDHVGIATAEISSAYGIYGGSDDTFILVRNNSGTTLSHGNVVIWDVTGTLGWDVTTTTSTNVETVAGVVPDDSSNHAFAKSAWLDGTTAYIQIRGINDDCRVPSGGSVTAGQSLGTAAQLGNMADGDGIGVALAAASGEKVTAWINIDN